MEPVFLRNGRYAAHVALRFCPLLGCFGEEIFKSAGAILINTRPSFARTKRELPSSDPGGLVSILGELMDECLEGKRSPKARKESRGSLTMTLGMGELQTTQAKRWTFDEQESEKDV